MIILGGTSQGIIEDRVNEALANANLADKAKKTWIIHGLGVIDSLHLLADPSTSTPEKIVGINPTSIPYVVAQLGNLANSFKDVDLINTTLLKVLEGNSDANQLIGSLLQDHFVRLLPTLTKFVINDPSQLVAKGVGSDVWSKYLNTDLKVEEYPTLLGEKGISFININTSVLGVSYPGNEILIEHNRFIPDVEVLGAALKVAFKIN